MHNYILDLPLALQEAFVQELEEIHESWEEEEMVIEGEFASENTMESWGWNELLACICL